MFIILLFSYINNLYELSHTQIKYSKNNNLNFKDKPKTWRFLIGRKSNLLYIFMSD